MKTERKGDWCTTLNDIQFWPLDPRPEEICIEDIAGALSKVCRFGGHTKEFYSVAQHSCLVAELVERHFGARGQSCPEVELTALLHDASEAYTGDMVSPLKVFMPEFKAIEKGIEQVIAEKFKLIYPFPPLIKHCDCLALMLERRWVLNASKHRWCESLHALEKDLPDLQIIPWSPIAARREFLEEFKRLRVT